MCENFVHPSVDAQHVTRQKENYTNDFNLSKLTMDIAVILQSLPETIHTYLYVYDERKYLICTMFKAFNHQLLIWNKHYNQLMNFLI